jgi:hypothetical protein
MAYLAAFWAQFLQRLFRESSSVRWCADLSGVWFQAWGDEAIYGSILDTLLGLV